MPSNMSTQASLISHGGYVALALDPGERLLQMEATQWMPTLVPRRATAHLLGTHQTFLDRLVGVVDGCTHLVHRDHLSVTETRWAAWHWRTLVRLGVIRSAGVTELVPKTKVRG